MKLKRAVFRHIEAEIYAYRDTLNCIEELRRDIILSDESLIAVAVGREIEPESKVERRATRLADSILLREMKRITEAIATVYGRAGEGARRVVWVKYELAIGWKPPDELVQKLQGKQRFDLPARDMAGVLAMDESTFHRYRTGFVYGIAEKLGWH